MLITNTTTQQSLEINFLNWGKKKMKNIRLLQLQTQHSAACCVWSALVTAFFLQGWHLKNHKALHTRSSKS